MTTMRDVARLAGVSIATVSFVVNGTKQVSEPTRARVEAAMEQAGYRRNAVARALASRRTRIIAILYPPYERQVEGSAFQFFVNAATRAEALGYTLIVSPAGRTAHDVDELMGSGLVEGAIVMEVRMEDDRVDRLRETGAPFVLIGRTRDVDGVRYADIDFEANVSAAVDALADAGHTELLLVDATTDPADQAGYAPPLRARASFIARVADRGLRGRIVGGCNSTAAGAALAQQLVDERSEVTGILFHDILSAAGLTARFRALGVAVPADVSIALLDSSATVASMYDPPLDVWAVQEAELGRLAVDALVAQLEGDEVSVPQTLVPGVHVPGGSIGPARVR